MRVELVEPRPQDPRERRPDLVRGDPPVEHEGAGLGAVAEDVGEQVLDVVDLDAAVLHLQHEVGVVRARLLHPDHVVEQEVVAVAGRQPLVGERRARHHHLAELADLRMDAELHGQTSLGCGRAAAAVSWARLRHLIATWMGMPARISRKPRNTVSRPGAVDRPERVEKAERAEQRDLDDLRPGDAAPGPEQDHQLRQRAERVGQQARHHREQDDGVEGADEPVREVHRDEDRREQVREDQRVRRRAEAREMPEPLREHPVERRAVGHLPGQQREAVERAEGRDHRADRDEHAADRAPHHAGDVGERRGRGGEVGGGHHADRDGGDRDVDRGGDQHAEDRRARDGALGIDHVAGRHRRRLEAEIGPERQRRRGGDGGDVRTGRRC